VLREYAFYHFKMYRPNGQKTYSKVTLDVLNKCVATVNYSDFYSALSFCGLLFVKWFYDSASRLSTECPAHNIVNLWR